METFRIVGLSVLAVFLSTSTDAQWLRCTGMTRNDVYSLAADGEFVWCGTESGVYVTTDNGENWVACGPTGLVVRDLLAMPQQLFAATSGGGIFLSTNNGAGWTTANVGLANQYVDVLTVLDTNMFAGTSGGGVFRSTNHGASWVHVDSGLTATFVDALCVSRSNVFAGTDPFGVFVSTNGGTIWTQTSQMFGDVGSLAAYDSTVFAGFSTGGPSVTTDAGVHWRATGPPQALDCRALVFVDTTLFAGFAFGRVFFSSNFGTTWVDADSGLASYPVRALTRGGEYLFAGTWDGGVWRRHLSEMITSVRPALTELPSAISLYQNYPNPFNPSTTIRYELPKASHVSLSVYDILGREVATLVNEEKSAGTYSVRWDAGGVASGVYFYRLRAWDLVQTKRMMVVR